MLRSKGIAARVYKLDSSEPQPQVEVRLSQLSGHDLKHILSGSTQLKGITQYKVEPRGSQSCTNCNISTEAFKETYATKHESGAEG